MKTHFPKWMYDKDGKGLLVKTEEQYDALDREVWAESPAHFKDGVAFEVEEVEADPDVVVPGETPGTLAYPKWLYHSGDGRAMVVASKDAHDALVDKDAWLESPDLSAAQQANSVANAPPAGASLWETPVADVIQMLEKASLDTLEKTYHLEEQNPGKPRKTLLRELADMIEAAQKQASADADGQ